MNIVFMGTPDFAVPCLRAVAREHNVIGVYCQPDKKTGRAQLLTSPPVKIEALKLGLTVFTPDTLRDGIEAERLRGLCPDLICVVAYGKLLPPEILDIPKYGCINIHASLLPKYRGAAPIQWAVINGESETGVTSMYMAQGLDTGDMIFSEKTAVAPDETADSLHDRLSLIGAELLTKTVSAVEKGEAPRIPQDDSLSCYAPMLSKELSLLDFTLPADKVLNAVRGLYSWPCARTHFRGKTLKVFSAKAGTGKSLQAPGTLTGHGELEIVCGDGNTVILLEVALEGKKRCMGTDFVNGQRLSPGVMLGE